MFQAIAASDFSALVMLGKKLHHEFNDVIAAVLCLDNVFNRPFKFQNLSYAEISQILEAFLLYAEELRKISFHYHPYSDPNVQRLFGFETSEELIVRVPASSYIVSNSRFRGQKDHDHFIVMTSHEFMMTFPQTLRNHLQARIHAEDIALSLSTILYPCLVHAVYGECNTSDCNNRRAHVNKEVMDVDWYNARVRVVLQQIQLCQTLRNIQKRWNQDQQRE